MKSKDSTMREVIRKAEALFQNTKEGEAIDLSKLSLSISYGFLSEAMEEEVHKHVNGKVVYDFGAGECALSRRIRDLGASHVYAVDKMIDMNKEEGITKCPVYFEQFLEANVFMPKEGDVAFLSWPANTKLPGLLDILAPMKKVIYLGKNTNNSACAWPFFFIDMLKRKLIAHIPHEKNTLLVYGEREKEIIRVPVVEELGGIDHSKVYDWRQNVNYEEAIQPDSKR